MPRTRWRRSLSARGRGLPGLGDQGQRGLRAGRQHAFHRPQVHAQRDQAGLGPVVQIPLDPAQLGSGGVERVAAGLGQPLDPAGQLHLGPGGAAGSAACAPIVRGNSQAPNASGHAGLGPGQQRPSAGCDRTAPNCVGCGPFQHRRPRLPSASDHEAAGREDHQRERDQIRGHLGHRTATIDRGENRRDRPRPHAEDRQAEHVTGTRQDAPPVTPRPTAPGAAPPGIRARRPGHLRGARATARGPAAAASRESAGVPTRCCGRG